MPTTLKLKAQIFLEDEIALGPGKADLLDAITSEGSISGAGRKMGLSYRRAWLLVDTMNRCFERPLVVTAHGGSRGGGARLSPDGEKILAAYRALQADLKDASKRAEAIISLLRAAPLEH